MILLYFTYLEAKEEAGQQQCCQASALTCSLVLLVPPTARLSKSPYPLVPPPARLSSLPAPTSLLRPPFYLPFQPA